MQLPHGLQELRVKENFACSTFSTRTGIEYQLSSTLPNGLVND